MLERKR